MAITLRDFLTFPFNRGRGIKKGQVDWAAPVDDADFQAEVRRVQESVSDDDRHLLDQIPAIIDQTHDLTIENDITWADSTSGAIAFRLDAPPSQWLEDVVWDSEWTVETNDAGLEYLALRLAVGSDLTLWRVKRTRGSAEHYLLGSSFQRIHKALTGYWYYGNPSVSHRVGDVFQVQTGTITGERTHYHGNVDDASFAAPDGNGNLAATVDTIDELVAAVDDLSVGGGAFLGLTDTPAAFGTAAQVPAVNAAGDALEFVDQSGGGGGTAERTSIYLDAAEQPRILSIVVPV